MLGDCPSGSQRVAAAVTRVGQECQANSTPTSALALFSQHYSRKRSLLLLSPWPLGNSLTQAIKSSANFQPTSLLCFWVGQESRDRETVPCVVHFSLYMCDGLFVILYNKAVQSLLCGRHLPSTCYIALFFLEVMSHFLREHWKACLWYFKTPTSSFLPCASSMIS